MKSKEGERSYFFIAGEYYGYPACCVQEFQDDIRSGKRSRHDMGVTGFSPCKKHKKLLEQSKLPLEYLIKNRICERPFPESYVLGLSKYIKNNR